MRSSIGRPWDRAPGGAGAWTGLPGILPPRHGQRPHHAIQCGIMDTAPSPTLDALTERALAGAPTLPARPGGAIAKMRYSHDAMVDLIVQNPWISQNELAATFGYTAGWVSQVISSDAFQARLAERKEEIVDPLIRATLEEQFKGLVARSLEVLRQKLDRPAAQVPDNLVLRAVELGAKAIGMGAQHEIPLPPISSQERLAVLGGRLVGLVRDAREGVTIDVTPQR